MRFRIWIIKDVNKSTAADDFAGKDFDAGRFFGTTFFSNFGGLFKKNHKDNLQVLGPKSADFFCTLLHFFVKNAI